MVKVTNFSAKNQVFRRSEFWKKRNYRKTVDRIRKRMVVFRLPFLKNKKYGQYDESKTDQIVPFEFFFEIDDGEGRENHKSDDFLHGLELCCSKLTMTYSVCRDLETVFEKSDSPACQYDKEQGAAFELQMTIPCDGHEDIGSDEKKDGFHFDIL